MEILYWLIPMIILGGLLMLLVLFWAIKTGQFDDMDSPATRILMDDDDPLMPGNKDKTKR